MGCPEKNIAAPKAFMRLKKPVTSGFIEEKHEKRDGFIHLPNPLPAAEPNFAQDCMRVRTFY